MGPRTRPGVDANAVVASNLRAIRERTGWTHRRVAGELARVSGRAVAEADVEAWERPGGRRPRFDAQELYLLSLVYDVPIAYFFLPPPGAELDTLADTGQPVAALYAAFLGQLRQLAAMDERLREVSVGDEHDTPAWLRRLFGFYGGMGPKGWQEQFYGWRADRLRQWGPAHGQTLDTIAGYLSSLALALRENSPDIFLAATEDGAGP